MGAIDKGRAELEDPHSAILLNHKESIEFLADTV